MSLPPGYRFFAPGLLCPQWSLPPGVRAVVSTREGGASLPPWASFNLGSHVGDDARAVAANRARLGAAIGAEPVWLEQVHGCAVADADRAAGVPDAVTLQLADKVVRFDPKTEKFESWAIPSGGGVVRNMVHTPEGNLWLACSGVNKIAFVEVEKPRAAR